MAVQRIVKMTFRNERCDEFQSFFNEIKDQIAAQPGCFEVKLLREKSDSGVFFTYSIWDEQSSLDAYRETELFGMVWPKVKDWFADKPAAWSTELVGHSKAEK
jgi:quinol monooxygenase YgiN